MSAKFAPSYVTLFVCLQLSVFPKSDRKFCFNSPAFWGKFSDSAMSYSLGDLGIEMYSLAEVPVTG
jgi:hypothetical protein